MTYSTTVTQLGQRVSQSTIETFCIDFYAAHNIQKFPSITVAKESLQIFSVLQHCTPWLLLESNWQLDQNQNHQYNSTWNLGGNILYINLTAIFSETIFGTPFAIFSTTWSINFWLQYSLKRYLERHLQYSLRYHCNKMPGLQYDLGRWHHFSR